MQPRPVPNKIVKTITVPCDRDTAFTFFTAQIDTWWPKDHSLSGEAKTTVYLEPFVGGRLYERTTGDVEYNWGEIRVWEPPQRYSYDWYLGSNRELPTLVEISFIQESDQQTRVEVTHTGPDRIGGLWAQNAMRYAAAWDRVLPAYSTALTATANH